MPMAKPHSLVVDLGAKDGLLRAPPPIPPNANGGRPIIEGAGQLTGSGPAVGASGPGLPAGNGTRGASVEGVSDTPPLPPPFPTTPTPPPHSSPPSPINYQTLSTLFCWHFSKEFSNLICRGLWNGYGLNCKVYVGGA